MRRRKNNEYKTSRALINITSEYIWIDLNFVLVTFYCSRISIINNNNNILYSCILCIGYCKTVTQRLAKCKSRQTETKNTKQFFFLLSFWCSSLKIGSVFIRTWGFSSSHRRWSKNDDETIILWISLKRIEKKKSWRKKIFFFLSQQNKK